MEVNRWRDDEQSERDERRRPGLTALTDPDNVGLRVSRADDDDDDDDDDDGDDDLT